MSQNHTYADWRRLAKAMTDAELEHAESLVARMKKSDQAKPLSMAVADEARARAELRLVRRVEEEQIDGDPVGRSFEVYAPDRVSAQDNAIECAGFVGFPTTNRVLHVEQIEAGKWEVVLAERRA